METGGVGDGPFPARLDEEGARATNQAPVLPSRCWIFARSYGRAAGGKSSIERFSC